MINNVVLVGRLTKDPDLRYTSNGIAVATFSLAVNRNYSSADGNRETDFINCVIWRKSAETLANYAKKGSLIGVTGRIQTRSYENQQGTRVYVTEVVCENFQLLESRSTAEQRQKQDGYNMNQSAPQGGQPDFSYQQSDPFASSSNASNQDFSRNTNMPTNDNGNQNASIDISDDDLPF